MPPIKIKTKPVLFILRRRENYKDYMRDINAIGSVDFMDEDVSERSEDDSEEFYAPESTKVPSLEPETSNSSLIVETPSKEELVVKHFHKDVDFTNKRNKSIEKALQIEHYEEQKSTKENQQGGTIKRISEN